MHQRHTYKIMSIVTILLGSVFISFHVSALTYQSEESVFFTINSSMNLTVSGDLRIDDLAPGSAADSNIITVTAGANTSLGYYLYANVGDAENNYTDLRLTSSDSVNKFAVLSSPVATLNDIGGGNWGYSYCNATSGSANCNTASNWVYGSTGNTSVGYGIMPLYDNASHSTDIKMADTNSADATTVQFKIGAKSASSQATGDYTNVVNFIGIPKILTTDYSLTYVDRSGTTASGTMPSPNPQTGSTTSAAFTISNTAPTNTNTNLSFKGWCTVDNASDPTSCSGTMINPGSMYVISSPSAIWSGSVYAVWRGFSSFDEAFAMAGKSKVNGYYQMGDISGDICASITNGTLGTLIDTRNNETYAVAKYDDGHCWMRQNLNLTMTAGVGIEAYNFATNSTFTYVPEQYGTTQTATGTAWNQNASDGARSYGGDKDKYVGGTDIATAGTVSTTGQPYEKIGVMYNWAAATAQSGAQAAAATSEVSTSICPKGWRLPANSGDYSFSELMSAYGLPTTNQSQGYSGQLQNPLNFNRPGHYHRSDGTLVFKGKVFTAWSSSGISIMSAHNLGFGMTDFSPQNTGDKGQGFSIRCVAV